MNLIQYLCTGEVLLTLFFLGKKSPWEAQIFSECVMPVRRGPVALLLIWAVC